MLGICYGEQAMAMQLGGGVEGGHTASSGAPSRGHGEQPRCSTACGKGARDQVWMSHGDRVTRLPDGFEVVGVSRARRSR